MTKYLSKRQGGSHNVYHTNRECPTVTAGLREASESEIEWHGLTECQWCATTDADSHPCANTTPDLSYQKALKDRASGE